MTEQNGVRTPSSIEDTEHPAAAASTSDQHPPPGRYSLEGPARCNPTSTLEPSLDATVSTRIVAIAPRIPKLSPSTTELLARVNGNNFGDIKDGAGSVTRVPNLRNPSPDKTVIEKPESVTKGPDKMKVSSAILALPTPPFTSSAPLTALSGHQKTPTPLPQNNVKTGLVAIAPKPQATLATPLQPLAAAPSVQVQPTPTSVEKRHKAAAAPRQRKNGANGAKRRPKKRRRGNDSDDEIKAGDSSSDESSDFTPTATQTKSGRQVHRPSLYVPATTPAVATKPKTTFSNMADGAAVQNTPVRKRRRVYRKGKEMNVNCIHCQRGHSPSSNMIVFCDECNRAWHQFCHDPPIEKEVITVKEAEWFCHECKQVDRPAEEATANTVSNQQSSLGPSVQQVPAALPETEVGGEGFSLDERRAYLSSLSHAALVNLLVTISDRNPTLPMFPSNLRDLQASRLSSAFTTATAPANSTPATAAMTPITTAPVSESSRTTTTTPNTIQVPSISTAGLSSLPSTRKKDDDESSDSSEYEVEEHRLYPRAGNGFRIPFTPEDLDILLEDPACPTFSYTLHGPAKAKAEAAGLVAVGGTA